MLVGTVIEEFGKINIVISGFVEAKYAEGTPTTLKFTHDTWNYVHKKIEKMHSGEKIVGWIHTHPNYGIFLSNYDLFIQENFFNMPFQVAYVIDPIQNIRGFFQWKNGKIEKLKGYNIYDEVGKPIKIEQTKIVKKDDTPRKTPIWTTTLIALLCIATVFLSFATISLSKKYERQLAKQDETLEEIDNQNILLNNQTDTIIKLQEQLVNGVLDDSGKTTATALVDMIENNELILQNQDAVLKKLKEFIESKENNGEGDDSKQYDIWEIG